MMRIWIFIVVVLSVIVGNVVMTIERGKFLWFYEKRFSKLYFVWTIFIVILAYFVFIFQGGCNIIQ
jgi:hypothetical protein